MPSKNTPQNTADVFTVDGSKTAENVATEATPKVIVDGEGFAVIYRKPNGQRAPLTYKTSDTATKAALAMLARVQQVFPGAVLVNVNDPALGASSREDEARDELTAENVPEESKGDPRPTKAKPAKKATPKKASGKKATGKKGMSALDAVAVVITENGGPMKLREAAALVVERKLAPGLKGKTPTATISAAVMVDCKKPDARFVKVERGVVDVVKAS